MSSETLTAAVAILEAKRPLRLTKYVRDGLGDVSAFSMAVRISRTIRAKDASVSASVSSTKTALRADDIFIFRRAGDSRYVHIHASWKRESLRRQRDRYDVRSWSRKAALLQSVKPVV